MQFSLSLKLSLKNNTLWFCLVLRVMVRQLLFSLIFNALISSTFPSTKNRPCVSETLQSDRCIQQCDSGFYRENISPFSSLCRKCGSFSSSRNTNGTRCECFYGYMRLYSAKLISSARCYSLKPSNVRVIQTSSDTVRVAWKALMRGLVVSRGRISYIVHCSGPLRGCGMPFTKVTRRNKVIFKGLMKNTKYKFSILPFHKSFRLYNTSISMNIGFTIDSGKDTVPVNDSVITDMVEKYNRKSLRRFLMNFVPSFLALAVICLMIACMFKSRRGSYMRKKYRIVKQQTCDGRRGNQEG